MDLSFNWSTMYSEIKRDFHWTPSLFLEIIDEYFTRTIR